MRGGEREIDTRRDLVACFVPNRPSWAVSAQRQPERAITSQGSLPRYLLAVLARSCEGRHQARVVERMSEPQMFAGRSQHGMSVAYAQNLAAAVMRNLMSRFQVLEGRMHKYLQESQQESWTVIGAISHG
ncbi:hypothetical protein HRR80_001694 [Exophiala dermatitidis]|uniref:Uncharacterized protein n=1 Tax=Exophiala dermatitidis TaxID=5970 RepID=A0AAN6F049_EXODE|nr:hypothetical protein HRR80_001694 [Exophiala dermatitidis]